MKILKLEVVVAVAILVSLSCTFAGSAFSQESIQGIHWLPTGYRWAPGDVPVKYRKRTGDALAVPSEWHDAIDQAAYIWSYDASYSFTIDSYYYVIDVLSSPFIIEPAETAEIEVSGSYYKKLVIRIHPDPPHPWGYPTTWYTHPTNQESPPSDSYNLFTAVAHEFGHCAGLSDVPDQVPLMYEFYGQSIDSLWVRKTPTEHDRFGIRKVYENDVGGGDCKPAVVTAYSKGAGLANMLYVFNLACMKGLSENSFIAFIGKDSAQMRKELQRNPLLRERIENFSEEIARDIHLSMVSGDEEDVPLSSSQIYELSMILDALQAKFGETLEYQAMRRLILTGEKTTFWSLFNTDLKSGLKHMQPLLYQNSPNPFNPSTTIGFDLPYDGHVRIHIYSQGGQLIRSLVSEQMELGRHQIVWDGQDDFGVDVSSGVYVYRIEVQDQSFIDQKKMVLLR